MKKPVRLLIYIFFLILNLGCNTLYNSRSVNLEIVEPGKVIFPEWVKTIAIRYNNGNVSYNPSFAKYRLNNQIQTDETNSDSIASEIYYNSFLKSIKNTFLFENISEIKPGNYSDVQFNYSEPKNQDSLIHSSAKKAVKLMSELLTDHDSVQKDSKFIIRIDPEYGLYSKNDLIEIRDSSGADLLLSLDYFTVMEEIWTSLFLNAYISTFWNIYNLKENKMQYFYHRTDTITWNAPFALFADNEISSYYTKDEKSTREIAIGNAAQKSGKMFAEFLTPHWIQVDRTIYRSGQIEMKKAEQLSNENRWLEAAKIWKVNTKNPNKKVAAKSMFNLALACEIEGNLDAAIDWVVKSYKVFEQKNPAHEFNCYEYFRVLTQRKLDLLKINIQLNKDGPD